MVDRTAHAPEEDLDAIFHALADRTRRGILRQLASGESSVRDIAAGFDMSLQAVSKHLQVLERAGLVVKSKEGRVRRCRLDLEPLEVVSQVVREYRRFWEAQLASLDSFLRTRPSEEVNAMKTKPTLVIEKVLDARPESVFDALTQADIMQRWFMPAPEDWTADVTSDPKVGGAYRVVMNAPDGKTYTHNGKYLSFERPRKLVFTWSSHAVENTQVSIELAAAGAGTKLTLTHDLLPGGEIDGHRKGWTECLDNLGRVVGARS